MIDLDEGRPSKQYIELTVSAHRRNEVEAAFVAVSASERQKGDRYLNSYADFESRLSHLGVEDIPHIAGMAYWDLSFWDQSLWGDDEAIEREAAIHRCLFPNIEFQFADYLSRLSVADDQWRSPQTRKWRNAWCDRQMAWAHDHHHRDVFVSSDRNFKRLLKCEGFEDFRVLEPREVCEILCLE